ncbi:MAG: ATP-binding protein [Eubacteriales bacterium]
MDKVNLESLLLFDNIRLDKIIDFGIKIYNEYTYRDYISYMEFEYYNVQRMLLNQKDKTEISGTYWQDYICRLVAESENKFSIKCEQKWDDDKIDSIAEKEIACIKQIYNIEWDTIAKCFKDEASSICSSNTTYKGRRREKLHEALSKTSDKETLSLIKEFYEKNYCGTFEKYDAFIWDKELVGLESFDKVDFKNIIGYETQKKAIIENTEYFLKGYRANNVLIYGDKGTGKSSCVKALVNHFKDQKLKIIELSKDSIDELYKIMEQISQRGCKFIIFIDDLSFEENESSYKHFKSVLEGGLLALPRNVLLHVTSNRINIIREMWSDRNGIINDVHVKDNFQERLSLADRFGLTITFTQPDKNEFLEIVKGLAILEKIKLDQETLISEALKWEMRYHSKSGRTAKQFINYISAREGNK